jgi:hypothetical protein
VVPQRGGAPMIGLNQSGVAAAGSEPVERGSFQVIVLVSLSLQSAGASLTTA